MEEPSGLVLIPVKHRIGAATSRLQAALSFFHACVSPCDPMYCSLSFNCAQVQTLPTEQATPALTDSFSRGYGPSAHACKARPLTYVGWTSLSVSMSINVPAEWTGISVFPSTGSLNNMSANVVSVCLARTGFSQQPIERSRCRYHSF